MYRRTQPLYNKSRADAGKWVLGRNESSICIIKPGLVQKTYQAIWEAKDEFKGIGQFGLLPKEEMPPFCLRVVKKMGRTTTPGLDDVKQDHLLGMGSQRRETNN